MEDKLIDAWFRRLALRILPLVENRLSVETMLDKTTMSVSSYRRMMIKLIISLNLALTALIFIPNIIIHRIFLMVNMSEVAYLLFWFFLSIPVMLAVLMGFKTIAILRFYDENDEEATMPDTYFYKPCDKDLTYALIAAAIMGIAASIISYIY